MNKALIGTLVGAVVVGACAGAYYLGTMQHHEPPITPAPVVSEHEIQLQQYNRYMDMALWSKKHATLSDARANYEVAMMLAEQMKSAELYQRAHRALIHLYD